MKAWLGRLQLSIQSLRVSFGYSIQSMSRFSPPHTLTSAPCTVSSLPPDHSPDRVFFKRVTSRWPCISDLCSLTCKHWQTYKLSPISTFALPPSPYSTFFAHNLCSTLGEYGKLAIDDLYPQILGCARDAYPREEDHDCSWVANRGCE